MSGQQEIQMLDFIKESNMIENIDRDPTEAAEMRHISIDGNGNINPAYKV